MKEYLPYIVSVLTAIVSGLVTYLVSKANCDSEINKLREANAHDLERMVEQHKVDIDSLTKAHKLEMEKAEKEHQHALELANNAAQNEMTSRLTESLFGAMFNSPAVQEQMQQVLASSLKDAVK